jgi:hypothetical protein
VAGGSVALLVFYKNFAKISLRKVADFSFKKGACILKQMAPETWNLNLVEFPILG